MHTSLFATFPLLDLYPLILITNLAFLTASIHRLLAAIAKPLLPNSSLAHASLLILLILWTTVEHPGDTFYWANGGIEYLVNAGAALLLFSFLLASAPSLSTRAMSLLLALYLGGSHELILLALILLLSSGALHFRHNSDPRSRTWFGFALLLSAFLILLITSPGAAQRATGIDGSFLPLRATVLSAGRIITFLPGWLLKAPVLLATLWLITEPRLGPTLASTFHATPRRLALGAALLLSIVSITIAAPAFALGGYLAPRVASLACLEFLLGWFLLVALASSHWNIPAWFTATPLYRVRPLLPAILCAALLYSPTCQSTAKALLSGVPAWSRATNLSYLDLQRQSAIGHRKAISLPVPPTPTIYFDYRISRDPQFFPNRAAASYFRLDSVVLPPPKP